MDLRLQTSFLLAAIMQEMIVRNRQHGVSLSYNKKKVMIISTLLLPEENNVREETYSCELSPFKPATALKKIRAFNQHKLEEFERYVPRKKERKICSSDN